jgi:transcriptional regulator with XRE-family HTH domain
MTTADIITAASSRLAAGTRIRDRRLELAVTMPHFFTAVRFAAKMHITVGHLYQIETGRVRASAALLERIARMLGMEANKLLAANGQIAPGLEAALIARPERWAEIERGLA